MKKGFTLIEMLVVIGIIGILAGMLLPALHVARLQAKKTQARTEIAQIETAWKSFLNDYRTLPSGINDMGNSALQTLRGDAGTDNKRRHTYMEFESAETEMLDPWSTDQDKRRYQVELDIDGNAKGDRQIAVWSFGPNGKDEADDEDSDDIRSWLD